MRRRGLILGVLLFLGLRGPELGAFGQEKVKCVLGPVSGTVVDPAGQPASGVKIQLIAPGEDEGSAVLEEQVTDAQGRFQLGEREFEFGGRMQQPPGIVAVDAQRRVGGTWRLPLRVVGRSSGGHLQGIEPTIKLLEVKEYHARLTDSAGKPVRARVEPNRWLDAAMGAGAVDGFEFSADLAAKCAAETAEDGSFVLAGVPTRGTIMATITAEGFAQPHVTFALTKPVTIQIDRPGSIRGKVTAEGQADGVAGMKLYLSLAPNVNRDVARDYVVYHTASQASGPDGSFLFEGVPPGQYAIRPQLGEDSPYVSSSTPAFEVRPGEEAAVTVSLEKAIAVRGKVVDKKTGAGIKDVRVYFSESDPRRGSSWSKMATTDADGSFTVYVKPGKIVGRISGAPEGYVSPGYRPDAEPIEVTKEMDWPTFELEPSASVEGIVVDEAGNPVAGAEVTPFVPDTPFFNREPDKTDQAGKFVLRQGKAGDSISIRARTAKAVSDGPVVVVPKQAEGPVKIVVSEKTAFTLQGTLVDGAGKAIPGVEVALWAMWRTPGGAIGFRLATAKTDEHGAFTFGALWPGDEYHIQVEAEGYDKYQSARVPGVAGQTHDFAKIVLQGAKGVVEGSVVDSAGKPMAGVEVFNGGDAPQPITTTTGAEGRFRLEGFLPGRVYVFARKPDYRFTGAATESGATGVQLKLLRKDEPVPPRGPQADYPSRDEQQEIVRKILERLWQKYDHQKMGSAIRTMARIDLEKARQWSREAGGRYDRIVRAMAAEQIAESDLDEALALVAQDGAGAFFPLGTMADRFAASDPAKAMRCAEEMALQARTMDQPWRAVYLAKAGRLVMRLGKEESGRTLVEEAAEMVGRMGSGDSQRRACQAVAEAVASYDPDAAMKLLEPITDRGERNRVLANIAVAVAPKDLAKAQEILKDVEAWYADRVTVPIAYELASTRPDDALRFVESATTQGRAYGDDRGDKTKAEALSWVAVAIAPRDQARAWALIDQAMEPCVGPHKRGGSWGAYGGRPATAAFIATRALEVGYPDIESIVYRVLASRATSQESYSPAAVVESNVAMATILALVDPDAARQVLQSVESRSEAIGSGGSGIGRDDWWMAWALADPRGVPDRVDRELAANQGSADWDISRSRFWWMLDTLTMPPDERLRQLGRRRGNLWMPGEERY